MEWDEVNAEQETPRPAKRLRDPDGAPIDTSNSDVSSHCSGRRSPIKQLRFLESRAKRPIVYCNFDDDMEGPEPDDVTIMRTSIQQFADGIGVLGYDKHGMTALKRDSSGLSSLDKLRFQHPCANDPPKRLAFGSLPRIQEVMDIVSTAREKDRCSGDCEDEWNAEVHVELLKLAIKTSDCGKFLSRHNV